MAANAARTAAAASVEAASATTGLLGSVTAGAGRIGSEVLAKEVGVVGGETSVLASHFAAVRQTATHLPPTGTSTITTTLLETTITQPSLASSSKVPSTLTSRIAQQALSKSTTSTTSSSSTLARLDLNVAQTGETIKEAASNALQEGLEEQLDKAMDMHKLVVKGAAVGSATTVTSVGEAAVAI
ncbi:hypothetical protein QFC21_002846 [Naganishia friedmannii]|uniref:Uncharacterized protein n=1 Tax=Naganishia friedmannii TaxID=89922 RepID=A0ACC2VV33_9TREE|nr:hypothetical protein QFC21_002846 [Naganishia friedmannii]